MEHIPLDLYLSLDATYRGFLDWISRKNEKKREKIKTIGKVLYREEAYIVEYLLKRGIISIKNYEITTVEYVLSSKTIINHQQYTFDCDEENVEITFKGYWLLFLNGIKVG